MKLKLPIAGQPLVLELKALLVLSGEARLLEFAEGCWTPFVFCEPAEPLDGNVAAIPQIEITDRTHEQLESLLHAIPQQIADFPECVRLEISKLRAGKVL